MIQTAYEYAADAAYAGQIADSGDRRVISRSATASVACALFLVRGASDAKCKVPAAAADLARPLGVGVYDATREPETYAANDQVPILQQGRVWVTAESNVTEGDPIFVRHTVNGATTVGSMRNDGDPVGGVDTARQVPGVWRSTATATNLAIAELNIP